MKLGITENIKPTDFTNFMDHKFQNNTKSYRFKFQYKRKLKVKRRSNKITHLLFGHPGVCLFCVPVEELKVHALLVEDASLLPQAQEGLLLIGQ